MKLVVVESPTKSKTIQKFLGDDFKILSSYGHIRDLPKSKLGIDADNNFEPQYIIPQKSRRQAKALKREAEKTEEIILATDEDREGEAISWHLTKILGEDKNYKRIAFHEITENAIKEALENPRDIDINLVKAQKARRVLDRLVGYKLSPFLWRKVARGLSAGRVQSVALRFIAEREQEIRKFVPEKYWTIKTLLKSKKGDFEANLTQINDSPLPSPGIKTKKETDAIVSELKNSDYKIKRVEKKETKKNSPPPFTTSALQQEAWKKLYMSAKATMTLSQRLYEKGHITYHRTDSYNLSKFSVAEASKVIKNKFGENYSNPRQFKTKSKSAQEAHEAIRPSLPSKTAKNLEKEVKGKELKLYDLIWRRFIASQMKEALFNSVSAEVEAKSPASLYTLKAAGQTLKFEGFLAAYPVKFEEKEIPELIENETPVMKEIKPEEHLTKPPARFSEASLIKLLEKEGIGRPSTYAPILDNIQRKNYVGKNKQRKFQPTEIGELINRILCEHFSAVVEPRFTANMEEKLDKIAEGKANWVSVIREFYEPFSKNLEKKEKELSKEKLIEETDKKCPRCGAPVVIRMGKFGKFYSCSAFPKCKYSDSLESKISIPCPKCEKGKITEKRTRRGKLFYGCSRYPHCNEAYWDKPTGELCPKCGEMLVEKNNKIRCSNKECKYIKKQPKKD